MAQNAPVFADVHALLESSWPRQRAGWLLMLSGVAALTVLALTATSNSSGGARDAVATGCMLLLLAGMTLANYVQARRRRAEQARLEMAEELVQLRHWPQAAQLLQSQLSRPATNLVARLQALVYFSNVLARFEKFEDVALIADHVLETIPLDAPAVHQVRLARAMSLLRQDRLFDADRAISELRHSPHAADSPGLVLLEMYRDVKTGHPREALETYDAKLELVRHQLGHRVADAYILAAAAHHSLGESEPAAAEYQRATLMAPIAELHRRYPETASLAQHYPPTLAPPEIAQGGA